MGEVCTLVLFIIIGIGLPQKKNKNIITPFPYIYVCAAAPEDAEDYWPAVYGLVLRGRLPDARNLLSHHSFSHTAPEAFASMDELLRKAPMIQPTRHRSRPELQRLWQDWRAESLRRTEAGHFLPLPQLQLLASVREL